MHGKLLRQQREAKEQQEPLPLPPTDRPALVDSEEVIMQVDHTAHVEGHAVPGHAIDLQPPLRTGAAAVSPCAYLGALALDPSSLMVENRPLREERPSSAKNYEPPASPGMRKGAGAVVPFGGEQLAKLHSDQWEQQQQLIEGRKIILPPRPSSSPKLGTASLAGSTEEESRQERASTPPSVQTLGAYLRTGPAKHGGETEILAGPDFSGWLIETATVSVLFSCSSTLSLVISCFALFLCLLCPFPHRSWRSFPEPHSGTDDDDARDCSRAVAVAKQSSHARPQSLRFVCQSVEACLFALSANSSVIFLFFFVSSLMCPAQLPLQNLHQHPHKHRRSHQTPLWLSPLCRLLNFLRRMWAKPKRSFDRRHHHLLLVAPSERCL